MNIQPGYSDGSLLTASSRASSSASSATRVALDAAELTKLDAVSKLPAEYPGWMFTRQGEVRRKQLAEAGRRPAAYGLPGWLRYG